METSSPIAKLCKVCSMLDIRRLTHPLYPCRKPLSCSTPPIEHDHRDSLPLGSVDEIKSRRFACDICQLVAGSLDKEFPGLDGECTIRESAEFCNFRLPGYVKALDSSITHFHFTQVSVIFDPTAAKRFHGPLAPWELKLRYTQQSHYLLFFQVKAKSPANVGNLTAPFQLTEQEFLDTVGGRRVATQVDARLIRAWLRQCECKHGENCMPPSLPPVGRDGEPIFQPTFVVDVIDSCLVDIPPRCRYIALSYVWGTAPVFRHLLGNTHNLRKTGSLRALPIPATIQDAIALVYAIGERYLWVDSICIIQDDPKMQQAEIMRMGSIYSRALFTIIAAGGDHANSGLPGVRPESREQVQRILRLGNRELLTVIDVRRTPSGIDDTVWAQRAWTFQERFVSNRVLVFSENQVYWSCRGASHSEEQALEEVRDIDRLHLSFPQGSVSDCLAWKPLQALDYHNIYWYLLYDYRQRRLTYQTDLFNAFNGVSEILAALQNDTFLWGLPESLFSYAMTWSFLGHSTRKYVNIPVFGTNGSQEMVPIPSWSWAAWSGGVGDISSSFSAGEKPYVRPVIHFDIVDGKHQLVRIKERPWDLNDRVPTFWNNEQRLPHGPLTQHSILQIGQLRFWTSFANMKAIRGRSIREPAYVYYNPFPYSGFQLPVDPDPTDDRAEIIHQDFIVIAVNSVGLLNLLAIEWRDGVAYRVGNIHVKEEDWLQVENRQWRFIILG